MEEVSIWETILEGYLVITITLSEVEVDLEALVLIMLQLLNSNLNNLLMLLFLANQMKKICAIVFLMVKISVLLKWLSNKEDLSNKDNSNLVLNKVV